MVCRFASLPRHAKTRRIHGGLQQALGLLSTQGLELLRRVLFLQLCQHAVADVLLRTRRARCQAACEELFLRLRAVLATACQQHNGGQSGQARLRPPSRNCCEHWARQGVVVFHRHFLSRSIKAMTPIRITAVNTPPRLGNMMVGQKMARPRL